MAVHRDKQDKWEADTKRSVEMYNEWFKSFAPRAFSEARVQATKDVEVALQITGNLTSIQPATIREHPEILPTLRMSTCPPLAVDRLIGLAGVSSNLVKSIENDKKLPPRMSQSVADNELARVASIIDAMADRDIFVWLSRSERRPTEEEIHRAAAIVADRLCSAVANPIIRNAQEERQLNAIKLWLEARGYTQLSGGAGVKFSSMPKGTFAFRMNVPAQREDPTQSVNIPIDAVIHPKTAKTGDLPIFLEAKSAGDFTNTNKRRKEEAAKVAQLRATYGEKMRFVLFLCGYFDSGYLGYEAAEGIDWVWEHRMDDLALLGA